MLLRQHLFAVQTLDNGAIILCDKLEKHREDENTMAKDKKVEQITDMEVDFAQWFTDVCKKAQLIDYSSIKGVFIYRPYGYAIWENIQRIMDAADIVDVVSDFVHLKRSGANYKGLCPFHNDRTPSFHVSKAKNLCKCFSCGKGGNPVGFIMEHEHYSYPEALRYLANKYGIIIEEKEQSLEELMAQNEREKMFNINTFAQQYFSNTMKPPKSLFFQI